MPWTNTRAKYPYVSRETWTTRYWLWRRVADAAARGERVASSPMTLHGVAGILLESAERAKAPDVLRRHLQWHVWLHDVEAAEAASKHLASGSGPEGSSPTHP